MPKMKELALLSTDRQIRPLLKSFVIEEHYGCADFKIYEEFALWGGQVRADIAALNGRSRGYEIKSGKDTFSRFAAQRRAYNDVFDEISLVATEDHLEDMRKVSSWWGVVLVHANSGFLTLERIRPALPNPKRNAQAIAALLWRAEALKILENHGLDSGAKSKNLGELLSILSIELPMDILADQVRQAIRLRGDWKSGARQKRCDGQYQRPANRLYYRRTLFGSKTL